MPLSFVIGRRRRLGLRVAAMTYGRGGLRDAEPPRRGHMDRVAVSGGCTRPLGQLLGLLPCQGRVENRVLRLDDRRVSEVDRELGVVLGPVGPSLRLVQVVLRL